ncbi:MAG: tetratricopeptide repeat protein [Woeseiaceae bacterium]
MSSLFQEFKRRNVFRVAVAYAIISWLVVQVADTAVPALRLPEWVPSLIFLLIALGFLPTLIFAWAFELTPEGIKREKDVDRTQSITGDTGKKLNQVTLLALALVVALVITDRFIAPREASESAAAVEAPDGEVSIAVLPFTDMSPDRDQDYFSDGITEEILNDLAKLKLMKVAGRTSSFAFKGRNEDLRDIGEALGVQHVLEGSVRKDGNKLRITAQLIKVSDGFHLWSETYDRELDDVFAVQDEISTAIVSELRGSLLGHEVVMPRVQQIAIPNYQDFLAARQLMQRRTNADLTRAREMLETIVAAEPDYPPALTSLAEVVLLLRGDAVVSYGDLEADEAKAIAVPLLERALQIDPNFADAFAVQGLSYYADGQWVEAEENLARAVELNPSLSNAWNWRALNASSANDIEASERYIQEAIKIDPLWLTPNNNAIYMLAQRWRMDEAFAMLERLRPFHDDTAGFHSIDSFLLQETGQLAAANRAAKRSFELDPDTPSSAMTLVYTYVLLQQPEKAIETLPPYMEVLQTYLTGEWDVALPHLRAMLGEQPLEGNPALIGVYMTGAVYNEDFNRVAELYDEYDDAVAALSKGRLIGGAANYAFALRELGRSDEADRLLEAWLADIEERQAAGVANTDIDVDWALYHSLTGNHDEALANLEQAITKGWRVPSWQYAAPLRQYFGEPRFEAIRRKTLDATNAERAKIGLEPVQQVGEFYVPDAET